MLSLPAFFLFCLTPKNNCRIATSTQRTTLETEHICQLTESRSPNRALGQPVEVVGCSAMLMAAVFRVPARLSSIYWTDTVIEGSPRSSYASSRLAGNAPLRPSNIGHTAPNAGYVVSVVTHDLLLFSLQL
ncbi:hypothetical protein DAEQUDRAFT_599248 [Daedalea quercina L-15889]|uniref:Uncharacterized protein n=1 Tax=Daedalea quercina L-15889 TaxID=1314783 RepID=A0A165LPU1_9APHY|nr:hypothetical protein DAEQUDRAFT_599248 [Daedalea quercina L-15889]